MTCWIVCLQTELSGSRLMSILKGYGEYPAKYRLSEVSCWLSKSLFAIQHDYHSTIHTIFQLMTLILKKETESEPKIGCLLYTIFIAAHGLMRHAISTCIILFWMTSKWSPPLVYCYADLLNFSSRSDCQ